MTLSRAFAAKLRRCWCPLDAMDSPSDDEPPPAPPSPQLQAASALKSSLAREQEGRRRAPIPDGKTSNQSHYTDDSSCAGLSSVPNSSNRTSRCYEHRSFHPFVAASLAPSEPAAPGPLTPGADTETLTLGFRGSWTLEAGEQLQLAQLDGPSPRTTGPQSRPSPSQPSSRNTQSYPPATSPAPPPEHSHSCQLPRPSEISPAPNPAWPGHQHHSMHLHLHPPPTPSLRLGSAGKLPHAASAAAAITVLSKDSTSQLASVSVVSRDYQLRRRGSGASLALAHAASGGIASPAGMPPGYWPALAAIMGRRLVRKSGSASMHQDRRLPSAANLGSRPATATATAAAATGAQRHRRSRSDRKGSMDGL